MIKRFISFTLCVSFLLTGIVPPAMAQEVLLPPVHSAVTLSPVGLPSVLRGIKVDAEDPLSMDFLVAQGHSPLSGDRFNDEALKLVRYFLASLTIPEKDLWVNLSPYENDRIVQDDLGRTGMGRDLLAQDYILKQLTAGLLHPDSDTGKIFWAEIYKRAYEQFGTTDIPVDTFNKVWIVPARSVVYESRSPDGRKISAFVEEMKLKVMLETDYLARQQTGLGKDQGRGDLAKDVLRQVIIPILEKEVNEGENFTLLRQMCYSLVLSVWLKKKLMFSAQQAAADDVAGGNILAKVFINRHKTAGVEIPDAQDETRRIYERYVEAFKRGAYDLIKEEVDAYSQELIPRKYFAGGFTGEDAAENMQVHQGRVPDVAGDFAEIEVDLKSGWVQGDQDNVFEFDMSREKPPVPKRIPPKRSGHKAKMLIAGVLIAVSVALGGVYVYQNYFSSPQTEHVSVENLAADDVSRILELAAGNFKSFEDARSRANTPRLSSGQLLSRMMGKPESPVLAEEFASLFQEYFDVLCPDIRAAGVSSRDMFQTAVAIMFIEGNFDPARAQGDYKDRAPAFGLFQVERNTMAYILKKVPSSVLQGAADPSLAQKIEALKKEAPKIMGDGNYWNVKAVKKSVLRDWRLQFAMVLMFWNEMFTRDISLPEDSFLKQSMHVFEGRHIELDPDIQERLRKPRMTMKDSYERICQENPGLSSSEIFQLFIAASHKSGGPRPEESYREIIDYFKVKDNDARKDFHKQAVKTLNKAIVARKNAWQDIEKLLSKAQDKKGKKIRFRDVEALKDIGNNNPAILGNVLDKLEGCRLVGYKLQDDETPQQAFLRLFFNYAESLADLRQKQRNVGDGNGGLYVLVANNLVKPADVSKSAEIGKEYRSLLNAGKADPAQTVDNSELGGIDLAGQEAAMDVRGRSGTFNLNFSAEQVQRLDQDMRGFFPVIINVQPVNDVKMFLGLGDDSGGPAAS